MFSKDRWPSALFLIEVKWSGSCVTSSAMAWRGLYISKSPWQSVGLDKENVDCISYFSIPVTKHQDQGNVSKERFILDLPFQRDKSPSHQSLGSEVGQGGIGH